MDTEERMQLSRKELRRLDIVMRFLRGEISRRQSAELMELTQRQVSRIARRVEAEEARGVIHRARGRRSNNRITDKTQKRIMRLYEDHYDGFGPTLAMESLGERDGVTISRESLRQWLLAAGVPYRKRHRKTHRQWRERKECFGEMVQMDGSRHDWFEGRGPECTLMGYIDDATGNVFARFYEYEGTIPAMDSFRRYVAEYGLPGIVYLDQHGTYKSWGQPTLEEELNGESPMSHFGRALKELGVQLIHARSPQAKGRIERLFGTFQDRVVKLMRLEDVKSIEEGNRFLDTYLGRYNRRYRKQASREVDLHGEKPGYQEMLRVMVIREERVVRNDSTIQYQGRVYHLLDRTWSKKVMVEDRLDGRRVIRDRNRDLHYEDITKKVKLSPAKEAVEKSARPPRGAARVRQARVTFA